MNATIIKKAFSDRIFFYDKKNKLMSDARMVLNLAAFDEKEQLMLKSFILKRTGDLESFDCGRKDSLEFLKDFFEKNEKEMTIDTQNTNFIYKNKIALFTNNKTDIAIDAKYAFLICKYDKVYSGEKSIDPIVVKTQKGVTKLVILPISDDVTNLGIGKKQRGQW